MKKEEIIANDNASIAKQDKRGKIVAAIKKGRKEGEDVKEIETVMKLYQKGKSAEEISDLLDILLEKIL